MHDGAIESSPDQYGEAGIGIRRHILVLAAKWRQIVLGAILAAGVGGALMWAVWTFLPSYEASADAAIILSAPKVSIDETLRTGATDNVRGSHKSDVAKRAAFVGLVHNGDIARSVVERLGGQLEEDQNETTLLDDVTAELVTIGIQSQRNSSDLIRITARARSPRKAMDLVDAWAEEYVKVVNRIYEKVPASLLAAINAELEKTQERFLAAQEELEDLISSSEIGELDRQIGIKTNLVSNWHTARGEALASDFAALQRLISQLSAARLLRDQLGHAGVTNVDSNRLALLLLKTESYSINLPALQISTGIDFDAAGSMPGGSVSQAVDVEALIAALQDQIREVQLRITQQYGRGFESVAFLNEGAADSGPGRIIDSRARSDADPVADVPSHQPGANPSFHAAGAENLSILVARMEQEIRLIERKKEKAEILILEARKRRNLLSSSLDSLKNEVVELNLVRASAVSTEVRLASSAVLPELPAGPHPILVAAVSGFAGLLAMVCFVLLMAPVGARPLPQE